MWWPPYLTKLEAESPKQEIRLQPLPCRIVVGREENLLWPRDLHGFTGLQQELLCLQTSPWRTTWAPPWQTRSEAGLPPWMLNISGVGWREIHPVQDSVVEKCESIQYFLQSSCVVLYGPTVSTLGWCVYSAHCCTPQVRKLGGEVAMISLLLFSLRWMLVVYLPKIKCLPKHSLAPR